MGGALNNATGKSRPQTPGKGAGTSCPEQQPHRRPVMESRTRNRSGHRSQWTEVCGEVGVGEWPGGKPQWVPNEPREI